MSLGDIVENHGPVRVWHVSRDSRVWIAVAMPAVLGARAQQFVVQVLNKPKLPRVILDRPEFEAEWLLVPRIDAKWFNTGSVWVRNGDQLRWDKPVPVDLRFTIDRVTVGGEVRLIPVKSPNRHPHIRVRFCSMFEAMFNFVRLWGAETYPAEPSVYQEIPKKPRKPRPKKEAKTALDRVLDGGLDLED